MVFRRLILNALWVGLLAGLLLSAIQLLTINPIILAAEEFEVADSHSHDHHGGAPASHHVAVVEHQKTSVEEAWAPADGSERTFYTFISNIAAGIGFAALLLALMSQLNIIGMATLNPIKGLLWGCAGFAVFFLAPAIGLPPEIPGVEAAPIEHRQAWWLFTVVSVGAGLLFLTFSPLLLKVLGPVLIALPYLMDIPHSEGPAFSHTDPAAVEVLTQLHQQFILASAFGSFVFWLALGGVSAWAVNRLVLRGIALPDHNTAATV